MSWLKIKRKVLGLEVDTKTFLMPALFFRLSSKTYLIWQPTEGCEIIKSHCPVLTSVGQWTRSNPCKLQLFSSKLFYQTRHSFLFPPACFSVFVLLSGPGGAQMTHFFQELLRLFSYLFFRRIKKKKRDGDCWEGGDGTVLCWKGT